ncbi:hypothetical protein BDM02DRAFT_3182649 [Thelephora ganbajun]|uniref:Uncharacterized protein n=1 Tax=Thelephora ganbajun TaxID=370292 RepID=A0ACB6ZVG5_THEGA|nr:hypothetical protein BDM02DRAFT_3182649 [Thelephora ganbajun]
MASSRQSHCAYTPPLSPSAADQDILLSASNKAIPSSLKYLNNYIQKHYDRFTAHEFLERTRLVASFAEKENAYEGQISTLKAVHIDIAALLIREQAINGELRQKLDIATNSMARISKVVNDANFVFVDRKRDPHEIKQEESFQESMNVSDIDICPGITISSLLSQIETVVTEMNTQDGPGQPSPVDSLPSHSIIETLSKVLDSLLATQRTFALLQEDFKSVDAARVGVELQNESLRENILFLQEELKQMRSSNERISHELAAARLERQKHICQLPVTAYPTPAAQNDSPVFLPSPLEKRASPAPNDVLQDTPSIGRKTNQTLPKPVFTGSTSLSTQTPTVEARPLSTPTSTSAERRRVSFGDAVKRVQANPTSSIVQNGLLKSLIVRDDQNTAGPSRPPPSTSVGGIKRTSSGVHKCQNVSKGPPLSLLTSTSAASSISNKANNLRPQKKRRINGACGTPAMNQKHKSANEILRQKTGATHTSTSTTGLLLPPSPKPTMAQLPKTNAADLKSLKFNKKSQPSKPPPTPAAATSSDISKPIATPTKPGRAPIKPLDLAKKSPQERAAMRLSR